ncbi:MULTISPECIES: amidohydrolase family protein [unclassified Novosphingobium]|uniref:amidohydrolase family protein n=1 Tax=unclassified Novosphingobium TaxID=2644732 RepID=UPI000A9C07F9|nr:amidohydrolase family protein [Novosphingobium sp. NDB2Meth1]
MSLILRQVRPWGGALTDIRISDGRIADIGLDQPRAAMEIDCAGDTLLPGLHDHHLHILALAARRQSVDLAGLTTEAAVRAALVAARPGPWLRAVGYDERAAGLPDTALLDRWVPDRPVRLQDRTGALWVLNSAALAALGTSDWPPGAERDAGGHLTGQFWREDRWLARALPRSLPDLGAMGGELAAFGLTGLTDAGAHNGPDEARLLAGAVPQRLILMGSEALGPGEGYALGALKLLIDERDPPEITALAARIGEGRRQQRAVAAHCVTEAELALFLAALEAAGGARPGDRIEHGGLIPETFVPVIAAAGLTVVTNPAFIHDRGDRYLEAVAAAQHGDLYPAARLARAGIALLGGSDAPYAAADPWLAMRSARDRRTARGVPLGPDERLEPLAALRLYCGGAIAPGAPADLILCEGAMADVLADLTADRLRMSIVGGKIAFNRDEAASPRR